MLSDRERETLREVERQLLNDDPKFARSFAARARRLPQRPQGWVGMEIFLVAGLLISGFLLVAGSLGGAMAFAAVTVFVWLAWRFSADEPGRSDESRHTP